MGALRIHTKGPLCASWEGSIDKTCCPTGRGNEERGRTVRLSLIRSLGEGLKTTCIRITGELPERAGSWGHPESPALLMDWCPEIYTLISPDDSNAQ